METAIKILITSVIGAFVGGWYFMLAVGIAHAEWVHNLPTIGFGPALVIAVLLSGVITINSIGNDS